MQRLFPIARLLLLVCAGCRLPGPGPSEPHVVGNWTGRVTTVKVFDQRGREYEAAALEILSGPKGFDTPMPGLGYPLTEYVRSRLGRSAWSGRVPLLVEDDVDPRIIPTGRVPVGRKVRVNGMMMVYHVSNPMHSPVGDASVARAKAQPDPGFREHVLFIDGPLRPMSD